MQKTLHKFTTCLWFDSNAEEAIKFYTSIFRNSNVDYLVKYGDLEAGAGTVKHAAFRLDGQQFIVMDSPFQHAFGFTPATSFVVKCETQDEVDDTWEKLRANGGSPSQCGWLIDKVGVSWQVVPAIIERMMTDKDKAKREKVLAAVMKMQKLDIAELEKAYNS